jgi:hypothetical protein
MSGQDEDRSSASGLRLTPAAATYDDFGMRAVAAAASQAVRPCDRGVGRGGHRGRRGAFDALLARQCGVRTLAPFLLLAFLRGRNMDAKSKIGVCPGVGGPVRGVPLVGDGGSLGEVGDGLVVAAEEEG